MAGKTPVTEITMPVHTPIRSGYALEAERRANMLNVNRLSFAEARALLDSAAIA